MKELNNFRKYLKEESPKQDEKLIPRTVWFERGLNKIYREAVKLSRKGEVDDAINKFEELPLVGISFVY